MLLSCHCLHCDVYPARQILFNMPSAICTGVRSSFPDHDFTASISWEGAAPCPVTGDVRCRGCPVPASSSAGAKPPGTAAARLQQRHWHSPELPSHRIFPKGKSPCFSQSPWWCPQPGLGAGAAAPALLLPPQSPPPRC